MTASPLLRPGSAGGGDKARRSHQTVRQRRIVAPSIDRNIVPEQRERSRQAIAVYGFGIERIATRYRWSRIAAETFEIYRSVAASRALLTPSGA